MPGKRGRPTRISRQRRCGNCDDEHGAAHGKRVNKKKEVSEQIPEDENVNAGDACQTLSDTSSVTQQPLMPVVDEQSQTVTIFLVPMEKATVASPVDIVNLENNQDSSSQNQNLENQGLVEETHEGSMNEQASNSNNDVNLSSENPIDMELMDNFEGVSMREPLLIDTASEIVNFRLALDDNIDSDDEGEEALDLSTRPACQNTVETLENDVHVSFDRELDIGHTEKESDQDANQANVHEENYFNQSKDAENVQEHNNNSKHRDCDDEEEDDNKSVQDVAEGQECVEDQDSEQGSSNYEDYEPTTSVNDFQGNRSSSDGWGDDDSSFLGDEYSVHDSAEDNNDSQEDVDTDTLISEVNDCDNHNRQRIAVLPDHANDSAPENSDVVVVNENVLDNSELHRNDSDMGRHGNMQTNEEANANNVDESFNETIINNSQQSKGGISRMPKFTIAENLMLCRFVCADYEFLLKRDKNEDVRRMKNQKWKYIGEKVSEIKKVRRTGERCRKRFQQCRRLVVKMMEDRDIQDAEYNRWQELVRNTVRSMPKVARRFVTRPYRKRKTSNPPDYASYASSNTANQHDQPEEPSERDQETMNLPVKKVNNHTIIPQKANSCNATADKSSVGNKMAENGRRSEKRGHGKNQEHCELLNVTKVSDTQHTRQTDGTAVQNTVKLSKKKSTTTNVNNISDSLVTNDNDCAHNVNNRQQSSQRSVGKEKSTDNVLTNVSRPSCRPSVDFEVHDAVHDGSDSGCGNLHSDSQNSSISEDIVIGRAGKQKSQVPSGRKSKAKSNCQAVQPYYKQAQLSTTPCSGSMQIVPAHNREFDMTCKLLEVQQTTLQLLATIAEGQKQMLDNQKGMLKEMKQKNKRRKHKNNYRQAESSDFED